MSNTNNKRTVYRYMESPEYRSGINKCLRSDKFIGRKYSIDEDGNKNVYVFARHRKAAFDFYEEGDCVCNDKINITLKALLFGKPLCNPNKCNKWNEYEHKGDNRAQLVSE